jgi:predicted HicB family RNase H-like nuclease
MKKTVKMDAELHADVKARAAQSRISIEEFVAHAVTFVLLRAKEDELKKAKP